MADRFKLDVLYNTAAIFPHTADTRLQHHLYAANILSAGVALFRKKINFTFIPNLFVFGTMLYLLIFENAPRRAMIAVPFMIYNVIFLLSQWRDKPDGAQLAERFRMRIHKN